MYVCVCVCMCVCMCVYVCMYVKCAECVVKENSFLYEANTIIHFVVSQSLL